MHKQTRLYLWFLFLGIALLILLTILLYYTFHPLTQQRVPIDITVGDYTGVNLNTDAFHFGTLKPGSSSHRPIHLRADSYPVEIQLSVQGIPFVFPEQKRIILQPGQTTTIRLFAVTDILTPKKKYQGELIILTKKL